MTVEVRPAEEADVGFLVTCNVAMAQETEDAGLDPARLELGIRYLLAHPAEGFYLVAWDGATRVGTLMVTYEWSDWRNGRFWWVQSVYVPVEHRRRGIYSALYDAVKARASGDEQWVGTRLYVERDNVNAQATYRALGMTETHYRLFEELRS